MQDKIKVAVNGYGVIGKRVADAVRAQEDMALVGVSDVIADYRIATAAGKGIPVYASTEQALPVMADAGLPVVGGLHDLLENVDVVVDCTPAQVGAGNL